MPEGKIKEVFVSGQQLKTENTLFGVRKYVSTRDYFEAKFYSLKSSFSPALLHKFYLVSGKFINPYWGKSRKEVLELIAQEPEEYLEEDSGSFFDF